MAIKKSNIGHTYKCSGIPMSPTEYHFNMEKPRGITDDQIEVNEKKLIRFLEKFGLNLDN
ncbi:MAG: hypothetical protein UIL36_00840 [Turicibacter sp.]|nr:hypothetical protein [Turicibacter sp.]